MNGAMITFRVINSRWAQADYTLNNVNDGGKLVTIPMFLVGFDGKTNPAQKADFISDVCNGYWGNVAIPY